MEENTQISRQQKKYVLSADRLSKLPAVFTLNDLQRLHHMSSETARMWVKRMAQNGYIAFAGPRSGCYFNTLTYPDSPKNNLLDAVQILYPDAIVIGANVLHAYGWITQIPQEYDIAILPRRHILKVNYVNFYPRPRSWYIEQQQNNAILRQGESFFPIDSLTPAAALEDAQTHKNTDMWIPDPDDLYIPDDPEEDVVRIYKPRNRARARNKM